MPYKDPYAQREANRLNNIRYRARKKAAQEADEARKQPTAPRQPKQKVVSERPVLASPAIPSGGREQAELLRRWSRDVLVVPPGHSAAGQPMELPAYATKFLGAALSHSESLLCVSRKNAKSAICAVLALGLIAGPLRRSGVRIGICSLNKAKAGELFAQALAVAEASKLAVTHRKSPYPGTLSTAWGSIEAMAATHTVGHASGYDMVILDEGGLLPERFRPMVSGLRASLSAKDGRLIWISIRGDSPLLEEVLARAGDTDVHVTMHAAADDACALDDREEWMRANPTLGVIKSREYMERACRVAQSTPAEAAAFRSMDLNLRGTPSQGLLVSLAQWQACTVPGGELPPREGPVYVGLDIGGSRSMCALAAYWVRTKRLETWGAFGALPDLQLRGEADGVGSLYMQMFDRGELFLVGDSEHADCRLFLAESVARLRGEYPVFMSADRYKASEVRSYCRAAEVPWEVSFYGTGSGATADGSRHVRAFRRFVAERRVRVAESLLVTSALAHSVVDVSKLGNPSLARSQRSRVDVTAAMLLAIGEAAQHEDRPAEWTILGAFG